MDSTIKAYVELWTASDPIACTALAQLSLTEDALIIGPGYRHDGRPAIIAEALRFSAKHHGLRAVVTSGWRAVEQWVRFSMAMVDLQDKIVHEGWNFLELTPDGRICRVISFWGALPDVSSHWPQRLSLPPKT